MGGSPLPPLAEAASPRTHPLALGPRCRVEDVKLADEGGEGDGAGEGGVPILVTMSLQLLGWTCHTYVSARAGPGKAQVRRIQAQGGRGGDAS